MNFLVRTYEGKCTVRPDITFNKNKEDYYVPDDVRAVGWAPFVAARMSQAGKMISPRFAFRYWDSVAFGIMLYPSTACEGTEHFCIGTGSCFDRTTLLPLPLYNIETLESSMNVFKASLDGKDLFCCNTMGIKSLLEESICSCTLHSSARRGDFICRELSGRSLLLSREDSPHRIQCTYCENETLDIGIFF